MASGLIILALLIALSAAFSASETALFSVDLIRIRTLAHKGNATAALIEKLRADPKKLLGTILLGNNAINIGASSLATVLALRAFGDAAVGISTGVMTFLVLIFGEYIPKSYAAHHAQRAAFAAAKPLYAMMVICSPIVAVIDRIAGLLARHDHALDQPGISEDEIKTMTLLGAKAGAIEHGEKELIERVFLFNDITAEDVMTPRVNVLMLDGKKTVAEAMPIINTSKYSRFPVFEGEKNNIVGIVHIKDILEKIFGGEVPPDKLTVKEVALPAIFVPGTKLIDDLFREFQRNRAHMAMVVNEYGSIIGLVTLEDLLEELVGEISDESDVDEVVIKRIDKHTVLAHGDAQVQHVNRFFNTSIEAPEHRTISWVILDKLGSVPKEGQSIAVDPVTTAVVEKMENRRIAKVRLTKAPDAAPKRE
jgi:CBS domain containing-hemolysin-like protein